MCPGVLKNVFLKARNNLVPGPDDNKGWFCKETNLTCVLPDRSIKPYIEYFVLVAF